VDQYTISNSASNPAGQLAATVCTDVCVIDPGNTGDYTVNGGSPPSPNPPCPSAYIFTGGPYTPDGYAVGSVAGCISPDIFSGSCTSQVPLYSYTWSTAGHGSCGNSANCQTNPLTSNIAKNAVSV